MDLFERSLKLRSSFSFTRLSGRRYKALVMSWKLRKTWSQEVMMVSKFRTRIRMNRSSPSIDTHAPWSPEHVTILKKSSEVFASFRSCSICELRSCSICKRVHSQPSSPQCKSMDPNDFIVWKDEPWWSMNIHDAFHDGFLNLAPRSTNDLNFRTSSTSTLMVSKTCKSSRSLIWMMQQLGPS